MPDPSLITYYGGIAFGSLLLLAVIAVYLINRRLDYGGIILTIFGFALIGLPIWKSLDLNPRQGEFHVELRVLERQTSTLAGSVPDLQPSVISSLRYKVAIINQSNVIPDGDIRPVVAALQRQVNEHLSPVWGVSADLSFVGKGSKPPDKAWEILILDDSDQPGMIGYHDLSSAGLPTGKVFAATIKNAGVSWSVTASHELLNMLIGPRVNSTIFINTGSTGGRLYVQEIASPCETDGDGYEIDGVKVSDFVFPSWFEPSANPGVTQFDYTKRAPKALFVCPGGYISVYDIKGGEWRQILNNSVF